MSTEIDLFVVSTCSIRLLISSSVSGFPSTNSFLSLGSFLTTSSPFSWLFLKSSSCSRFKYFILLGREDSLLSFTHRHVRVINCRKISGISAKLLWLKFSDWICASESFCRLTKSIAARKSNGLLPKFLLLRSIVSATRGNVSLTSDRVAIKCSSTK